MREELGKKSGCIPENHVQASPLKVCYIFLRHLLPYLLTMMHILSLIKAFQLHFLHKTEKMEMLNEKASDSAEDIQDLES